MNKPFAIDEIRETRVQQITMSYLRNDEGGKPSKVEAFEKHVSIDQVNQCQRKRSFRAVSYWVIGILATAALFAIGHYIWTRYLWDLFE